MNAWCAPERVRPAHLANERAQFSRDLRPANTVARPSAPIRPKPGAVPANDRLRPDNRNGAKDGGEAAIEPNEQKTIGIVEVRSLRFPPAKHVDLLPQDQIFCFQRCSRPKERSQDANNQLEQICHQAASLPRPFPASTSNRIFGTHSPGGCDRSCEGCLRHYHNQHLRDRLDRHAGAQLLRYALSGQLPQEMPTVSQAAALSALKRLLELDGFAYKSDATVQRIQIPLLVEKHEKRVAVGLQSGLFDEGWT